MKTKSFLIRIGLALVATIILGAGGGLIARKDANAANGTYKILAWNDLGMHCYNRDFSDLAVLPPYNNLWVQVLKAGDPPTLVTTGITVEYFYADNTYSVGKTNFWSYSQPLFGVTLAPNVGLKGKGLAGTMDLSVDHFIAEGIPVTEYSDSAPTTSQPYQLATVVVKDSTTGAELARTRVVTPVSSEMRCDKCHSDTGEAKPNNPTGKVETNILQLHDEEEGTSLMTSRPVLCAKCHSSNALGAPGQPGLPSLSNAMHNKHDGESPNTLDGCYNCHPGPQTKCLRDTMSAKGMTCISCHGGMSTVKTNPNPWLNEPRCDTCHNTGQYNQNHALYRFSTEHGGLYCEACHDSTHAVAPSREANDAIKFIALQGKNGPIDQCEVCHTTVPSSGTGPHGMPVSGAPTVLSITRASTNPTAAASVDFTITFSKSVTGVDLVTPFSDFALTTSSGITGASITGVSGSGATYTVTVNTGSGSGTIRLDVPATATITDLAANPLNGLPFITGEAYAVRSVNVYIGGALKGSYFLIPGTSTRQSYVGVNNGPSQVTSLSTSFLSSMRVLYGGVSYSELMGFPASQLTKDYWFPYYNNVAMNSQLRVSNVGGASTTITVTYGNGTPLDSYTLAAGAATRKNYDGINAGPLHVTSSASNILTTIRVVYADQSYSELAGFPNNQLTTDYWYPLLQQCGDEFPTAGEQCGRRSHDHHRHLWQWHSTG